MIPTTSDRWMKAFRKHALSMYWTQLWRNILFSLSLKDASLSLSSMIVAASRMLTYLQSLQWCPVQNREINFYKGFFRKKRKKKRKKYQIFWVLKRKTLSGMIFLKQYINGFFFLIITQQVYMHLQHLETLNILHVSDIRYRITSFFFFFFLNLSLVHNKLCKNMTIQQPVLAQDIRFIS